MIRSSAQLESDDVDIRCRVRRSPYSQNPEFEDACEFKVVMRNWQKPQRKPSLSVLPVIKTGSHSSTPSDTALNMIDADCHQGPELLLRSVNLSSNSLSNLSERFHSFGSNGSNQLRARQKVWNSADFRHESPLKRSQPMGYCIPMSEAVVAVVHDNNFLFLTTQKHGYFEFSFDSKNSRDLMTAFLAASLPEERITNTKTFAVAPDHPYLDPICSFDVEALTNKRIEEQVKYETLSEKMRRKVAHVALQIGEMTSAISECACGACGATSSTSPSNVERRQSPPRYTPGDMEFAHSVDEFQSPCHKKSSFIPNLEPELESTTNSRPE